MTTKDEALKLALEALQKIYIAPEHEEYIRVWWPACEQAIAALREALAEQPAQQEAKIVRWNCPCGNKYTFHGFTEAPPQRKPLTDEEIWKFWCSRPEVPYGEDDSMEAEFVAAVRRILAAYCIKENT